MGAGGKRDSVSLMIYQGAEGEMQNPLASTVAKVRADARFEVHERDVPAVVGGLAGRAIEILVSDPVQAGLALVEIGALFCAAIAAAKSVGKKVALSKLASKPLAMFMAKEAAAESRLTFEPEAARVWGPMAVTLDSQLPTHCVEDWDQATGPYGTFMGIAVAVPRGRVRTFWFLFGPDGSVCTQWQTQTLSERVPDFLRPDASEGNGK